VTSSEVISNRRDNAVKSTSLFKFKVNALSVLVSVPSALDVSTCVAVYVIV